MRQQENLQLGIPRETAQRFPRRLQELCGYSVYKGQFGHIDNHDPIELLGRERGKRMVWEATERGRRGWRGGEVVRSIERRPNSRERARSPLRCPRVSNLAPDAILETPQELSIRRNRKYAALRPSRSAFVP